MIINIIATVCITSIIAAGVAMTTAQLLTGPERNEDHVRTVQQMRNVSMWFNRDTMMAENITAGDDPETGDEEFITVDWKDWESGEVTEIRYLWLDDVESLKKISRSKVVRDKNNQITENTQTLIADSIYSANVTQQGASWLLAIETRAGEKSLIKEYEVPMRLD